MFEPCNTIESLEIKPHLWPLIFDNGAKTIQEKIVFSANGTRILGYSNAKNTS
jgi:hypothetical protein